MKIITKIIYAVLGILLVLGGGIALFHPTIGIPVFTADIDTICDAPVNAIADSFTHFTMETGAAMLTLGTIFIYAIFNLEKMKKLNYLLLLFWVIMGGIHWVEFMNGNRTITSPLINSIPTILMGIVIFLRKR